MKKLTRYFLIFLTTMILITGFGIWFLLKQFFPELLVDGYLIIPLFFYLFGLITIYFFRRSSPDKPAVAVNTYMMIRVIKIFVSFVIMLIYWLYNKDQIRNFAIIFIIFYLIYMIWETNVYFWMEKYIKHKSDQKNPPRERIDQ
jgi:uncharacterized membrane protein